MATYPDLPLSDESKAEIDMGLDPARATNGALRVRARYPSDKHTFTLRHLLNGTQYATHKAWRAANKLASIDLTWAPHAATYTTRMTGYEEKCIHSELWDVTVTLQED